MNYNSERYEQIIRNKFTQLNVMVIGDVMVDEYVTGKVDRISPEAPIPVLNYKDMSRIAGGASNVAHNIATLGSNVYIVGVVGRDDAGKWLKEHLEICGINTKGLLEEDERPTTVKRRFATKSQQLLRVDIEKSNSIAIDTENEVLEFLYGKIHKIDAVVLSDYRKGMLASPEFVRKIIHICNQYNVIISIDSKSSNIEAFENATFVKPNNLELEQAVNIKINDEDTLNEAGMCYLTRSKAKALMVTRGAKGISIFRKDKERKDYPSKAVQVYDVTGAGDTVISTVTLGIASGLDIEEAIILGNLAASVVINKVGTVPIWAEELVGKIYEK